MNSTGCVEEVATGEDVEHMLDGGDFLILDVCFMLSVM
jgi:hypothetical protein